ncbi:MAG: AlpA family phage regulatory protein [Alteromonadales bacterium]|nr:AlpA family phage regulatory protein [Alteromonadales bacterium]
MSIKIAKQPSVLGQFHFSKSTLFTQVKQGLMPKPISLGARAVGYLQHELDAVLLARIAGQSNEQIKELVKSLVAKRKGGFQ